MGLFSKKKYADVIFCGGTVITMDENYPEAEAVAVRGGEIMAVGEFELIKDDLANSDTKLYDLQGRFMTPGLIDTEADCTPMFFKNVGLDIVKQMIEERERRLAMPEDADEEELDEAIEEEFEEASFLDTTPAEPEIAEIESEFSKRGITAYLNIENSNQGDDMFKNMLSERYQDGRLRQRYFGSQYFSRMVEPSNLLYVLEGKRTACNELDGFINFNYVDIVFSSTEGDEHYMSEEYLNAICEYLADHGYFIRFGALDDKALETAQALANDLSDGYKKQKFSARKVGLRTVSEAAATPVNVGAQVADSNLEDMTVVAAQFIGAEKKLGTIEEGKFADFAIFDSDPREGLGKAETILAGAVDK